jgi:hypothetical protein
MNLTASYITAKQQLISRYNGAEDGIFLLERSIIERPIATRAICERNGYAFYEKSIYPTLFDKLMFVKDVVTIQYAIHIQTNTLIFTNIL